MDNRTSSPPRRPSPTADTRVAAAREAFERLTMPHLADLARFARSLTGDGDRAGDLVQETYLQALRGWHTFRHGDDPKPWLFTICRHAFLRTVRREARYVELPDGDPELESRATAVAHWRAQETGVADIAERMDLGPAIDGALAMLPAHYRCVVVLVDVGGQSYEEAALVLDVPVGTVRSRLFRARRLLQDLLFAYARDAGFASTGSSPLPSTP
jgi:RNA polymerase sigma-70 factor, ECF subfamily